MTIHYLRFTPEVPQGPTHDRKPQARSCRTLNALVKPLEQKLPGFPTDWRTVVNYLQRGGSVINLLQTNSHSSATMSDSVLKKVTQCLAQATPSSSDDQAFLQI